QAHGTLSTRERGDVDLRIGDPLADPLVLDGPAAHARHALLVHLVVIEGPVVRNDNEQRDAIVHRGPDCGRAHQEVPVATDSDGQASAVTQRQCGANRDARSRADPRATTLADEIERMPQWP